jgi:membrane associated rhomboid family serine protease
MELLLSSPVTLALIAANVLASLIAFNVRGFLEQNSFWIEALNQRHEWHRALTSGFLHVALWHLLLNMLTLFSFGPYLEQQIGPVRYLMLYFGSLIGGSLWMYFEKRREPDYRAICASGAICGLLIAYALTSPFSTIYLMGIVPMWAIVFVGVFTFIDLAMSRSGRDLWAHGGHIGGTAAGFVLAFLLVPDLVPGFIAAVREQFRL